jgi:hypothetical protein
MGSDEYYKYINGQAIASDDQLVVGRPPLERQYAEEHADVNPIRENMELNTRLYNLDSQRIRPENRTPFNLLTSGDESDESD